MSLAYQEAHLSVSHPPQGSITRVSSAPHAISPTPGSGHFLSNFRHRSLVKVIMESMCEKETTQWRRYFTM